MAKVLQHRRGTTAENDAFTGAVAEITVDTDRNELRLHDGEKLGGYVVGGNKGLVNVIDLGAKGDGTTDNTEAFRLALVDNDTVYIPKGVYKLDTTGIDMARFIGDGIVWPINTGVPYRASGASIMDYPAFEELLGYPKTESTGTGSTSGTAIFPHSNSRAQQGGCYFKTSDGVGHYIVSFRTAESTDSTYAGNACRLVEFQFDESGKLIAENTQYTGQLAIGHGQGLGVSVEDGEVYLWSQRYFVSDTYKARYVSKTHWRGASTTNSDIQYIQLFANDSVNNVGVPTVSADGRFLINVGPAAAGFKVTGWELATLTDLATPAFDFTTTSTTIYSYIQGICADSHYIYLLSGSAALSLARGVMVFDYDGNHVKTVYCSTDSYEYGGFNGIISRATDLVYSNELEHIAISGGDLLIGGIISNRNYGDIVSDGTFNYAARASSDTEEETGQAFVSGEYLDSDYFQCTLLPANAGTFSTAKQYNVGSITKRRKFLYRLGASTGAADEHKANGDFTNGHDDVVNGYKDCSFYAREQNGFNFYSIRSIDGSVKKLLGMNHRGNLYLYDGDSGANSNSNLIYTKHRNGEDYVIYNGGNGPNEGGFVKLVSDDDTSSPYYMAIGANGSANIDIAKGGQTVLRTNPSGSSSWSERGIFFCRGTLSDFTPTSGYNAGYMSANTNYHIFRAYNRHLSIGSELLDGAMFDVRIAANGTATGGMSFGESMFPSTNGTASIGIAGNRWKQLFATSSTISTSDERMKAGISKIPDEVLDAWGDVNWLQFQMVDAIAEKGAEKARLHNGLVAQRIKAVFESHGLDATRYGLLCHDAWEAHGDILDENGELEEPAREAGDIWSVRYEEALAMEAAFQRRRADRMEARIAALEAKCQN